MEPIIDVPVAVRLQEGHDVATLVADPVIRSRLLQVGLREDTLSGLGPGLIALRTAQSHWAVTRDRTKPDAQREREERGAVMRQELLAGCDWNLRGDARAVTALARVREGDGVADLVQDLEDLAQLVEKNQASFAGDTTFDPGQRVESARSLAAEIRAGVSDGRLNVDQEQARANRDRAYGELASLLTDIRAAGRYAFRGEPKLAQRFVSAYLRRKRARQQSAKPEADGATPAPQEEAPIA